MLILLLSACLQPFANDRHDLVGFRVAAVSAPAASPGDEIAPSVAVIVDGHPWSPAPAELSWYWVDDADAAAGIDDSTAPTAIGAGPSLTVPPTGVLALVARHGPDEERAILEISAPPAAISAPTGFDLAALPLTVDGVDGPDLLLDARADLNATPSTSVDPGGFARISALLPPDEDPLVHWMATAGTFFELDRHTTDWAAGDITLVDDEIDGTPAALSPGTVTLLALALGDVGQTAFHATEIRVGDAGPGLWVADRWLPTDVDVEAGADDAVTGTLVADDDSPVGLVLTAPTVAPASSVASWGTEALSCSPAVSGPFDPTWLLEQVCGRDALDGAVVSVVPGGGP